jgi:HD-like signal output (HDOD) protein/ActR/RegA family two-component response regulator
MEKKRILFVDDEPHVLSGLESLLRKQRTVWEMSFASSGEEALRILASSGEFDVVVSDMRMPIMSGAELLRMVQRQYPSAVRIVLSGETELGVARRMVHVAHQFLTKPCDGRQLRETIERACNLQAFLGHPSLRQVAGQIGQLPVAPAVYAKLVETLENPAASLTDAAAIIETDMGTTTKILQLVNSSFFGSPRRVTDVGKALSYLGLEMLKALVLAGDMRNSHAGIAAPPGFDLDLLQEHGLQSARLARRLLSDENAAQDAFSAAMLQDVGALVMCARMPRTFLEIVEESQRSGASLPVIEKQRLGVTHAEIGAYLLGIWGLPYSVVEAVAHHHEPKRARSTSLDVVSAVHVGSALVSDRLAHPSARHLTAVQLDEAYLAGLGLLPRLDGWRKLASADDRAADFRTRAGLSTP